MPACGFARARNGRGCRQIEAVKSDSIAKGRIEEPRHPYYITVYQSFSFLDICTLSSGARGSFLTLSGVGHVGEPPFHHGASLGPGWAPWRALWAFKVAKQGKYSRGLFPRS